MHLWAGEQNMFGIGVVVLLVLYFYSLKLGDIISLYASGAGLWWEMRWRAIAESMANVALNWVFVQLWGIAGIVAATLVSLLFFNFGLATGIIFREYFTNGKMGEYFRDHLLLFGATAVVCGVSYLACAPFAEGGGIVTLIVRAVICTVVSVVLYALMYCRSALARRALEWMLSLLGVKRG
jgi:type IV secretory pathway VirB3-like protein